MPALGPPNSKLGSLSNPTIIHWNGAPQLPIEFFLGVLIGWYGLSVAVLFAYVAKPIMEVMRAPLSFSVLNKVFITYVDWVLWTIIYSLGMFICLMPGAFSQSPVVLVIGIFGYIAASFWLCHRRGPAQSLVRFYWLGAPPLQSAIHLNTRNTKAGSK